MRRSLILLVCIVTVPVTMVGNTQAANLADRISAVADGQVYLNYPARDGACGDGDDIITHRDLKDECWRHDCEAGPVRVCLRIRDHEVVRVKTRVGGQWRPAGDNVLDLGTLPSQAAVDYLIDLARQARGSVAEDAIFAAYLARDVVVWPDLLALARDRSRPEDTRETAIFWLGQIAGDKITEGLQQIAGDDAEELEIREMAIFVLADRQDEDSIPILTEIARTSPHSQLRRSALFWLAQNDDPRVLALFEEILMGK